MTAVVRPAQSQPQYLAYRADIDGLRAVAVHAVVGYHAFPSWLPGGYVGVDVFFVVSGYLISGILLAHLSSGRLSLLEFYQRRIRRIFPALILVLVVSYAIGWFVLFSDDYRRFGKHLAGAGAFISNFLFLQEASYFDDTAHAKPLLHLWSLAIEEQFYIVWPVLLLLACRRGRILWLISSLAIASFVLYVALSKSRPEAAFYLPVARFWELLLGGALAYGSLRGKFLANHLIRLSSRGWRLLHDIQSLAGIVLIGGSITALDPFSQFPSWRLLFPTMGTALIISAGPSACVNRTILSYPLVVWIGLISYPFYLWHWPLLSLAYIVGFGEVSIPQRAALVVASFVLAAGTYHLVEKPIRIARNTRTTAIVASLLLILVFGAGCATYLSNGFPSRQANHSEVARFLEYYRELPHTASADIYRYECGFNFLDGRPPAEFCIRPGEKGTLLLWGDSHARQFSAGIRGILPAGYVLAEITTHNCPPSFAPLSGASVGPNCNTSNEFAIAQIRRLKPASVILAQKQLAEWVDWTSMAMNIRSAGGKQVILLGPVPRWQPSLPLVVVKHRWGKSLERVREGLLAAVFDADALLSARYRNSELLSYVSLLAGLCNAEGCLATVPEVGGYNLIAYDYGHLTPAGSMYVANMFLRASLARQATMEAEQVPER